MSSERSSATGMPRWVKIFAIAAAALVVLFVVAVVTGFGGPHGPGRHAPSDPPAGDKTSATAVGDPRWS